MESLLDQDYWEDKSFSWSEPHELTEDQLDGLDEMADKFNTHSSDEVKKLDDAIFEEGTKVAKKLGLI